MLIVPFQIFTVSCFPALNARFVSYGSRSAKTPDDSTDGPKNKNNQTSQNVPLNIAQRSIDYIAVLQVPHGYFLHFYVVALLSSVFWLIQIGTGGSILRSLCASNLDEVAVASMSVDQVLLTWSLLTLQGVRRLLESIKWNKSSASKMWFVHWLLGIAFYLAMGMAVWMDGAEELLRDEPIWLKATFAYPSLKTMLSIPLFLMASGIQHDCHNYLASLPKYSLPQHPIFNTFVCPHYTAECLIYLSMAMISAPPGLWINRTIFAAAIFVTVNLSVTASSTKLWYEKKFGKEKVAHRACMLPGVW